LDRDISRQGAALAMRCDRAFHHRLLLRPVGRGGSKSRRRTWSLICRVAETFTAGSRARFARELRAGSSFHVESAALSVDNGLRLGHRFVDSANVEVVTWFDEHWDLSGAQLTPQQRGTAEGRLAAWNGPVAVPRPEPVTTVGLIPSARRSSPLTSTAPTIPILVRSCIPIPTTPVRLALRSAWMPISCNGSAVALQPLN
jgi:hypothetical protein